MGIFSLPVEPTRCLDSLLWFAPSPWSPLRLTPCSLELATLDSAMLVLATLVQPSLPVPPLLPLPSPPLPTPHPLLSASLPPVSMLPMSPSPATSEPSLLPLPLLPPVSSEATPPSEATTARGRLRPSPTSATPVLATLDLDTATLGPTATASLLPVSTPPTSPSLAGGSTKQTSIATFSTSFCALR